MQIWLTSFILLFGAVEFWQWAQHASLPMPIFLMGGALLAIASNYGKSMTLHLDDQASDSSFDAIAPTQANQAVSPATSQKPSARTPISFEIQKPFKPRD